MLHCTPKGSRGRGRARKGGKEGEKEGAVMKETNRAMEWKFQTQEVKTLIILAVKFVFSQIPWNLEYCV